MLPQNPMAEAAGHRHDYINTSWGRHLVASYTGLNFHDVGQLDYGTYLLWLRDAYLHTLNSTAEGREYLDDAWRLTQVKPDRGALRRRFGKGGQDGH